jgi:hypothetical protein
MCVVNGDDRLQPRLGAVKERHLFMLLKFLVAEYRHSDPLFGYA